MSAPVRVVRLAWNPENLSPQSHALLRALEKSPDFLMIPPEAFAPKTLRESEDRAIELALDEAMGNRSLAARKLGIAVRTMRKRLHELGYEKGLFQSGRPHDVYQYPTR